MRILDVPAKGTVVPFDELKRGEVAPLEIKLGTPIELPKTEIIEDAAEFGGERRMLWPIVRDETFVPACVDKGEAVQELVVLGPLHGIDLQRSVAVATNFAIA